MAKQSKKVIEKFDEAPITLDNHPFYGFQLDEDQKYFRDSIWNPDKKIIMCDAKAGSGKTTVSFATANLLYEYGLYDGIVYVVSPYGESKQGFLPGSITEKSEVYFEPIYQAIIKCGLFPMKVIYDESMVSENRGSGYVKCITHTYLRGTNFENKVVILDETQNYSFSDLKKALTRITDSCKVIVIGHTLQKDNYDTTDAFQRYIRYYDSMNDERVAICKLTKNYRGWISQSADELTFDNSIVYTR
jgi:predicted ribonuclease YlaK